MKFCFCVSFRTYQLFWLTFSVVCQCICHTLLSTIKVTHLILDYRTTVEVMVKVARSLPLAYKKISAVEFVYPQNQGWSKHLINIFLSYPPVDDRAGPWNTAMNAACVLHITTALLHRSCDFYCFPLFSRSPVSFGAISVIVTSWFLPRYAQCYRSTKPF